MSSNIHEPADQNSLRIPVIEEQLAFGTCVVETGCGLRIHKAVTEQPVTIDERLARDEVQVRQVPVDRIVSADKASATRYKGKTLVIPTLEEILVVEWRLRIKEDLHITRTQH